MKEEHVNDSSDESTEHAGRIDVQFHFSPAFYTERLKQAGGKVLSDVIGTAGSFIVTDAWSVNAALAYTQKYHVATDIMSVSTPSLHFVEPAESVTSARALTVAAARIAHDHPGRFGNFATLPMLDVPATLQEIARCLGDLDMDGACMMSNVNGRYLGHADYAPIFDEFNRRKAVVSLAIALCDPCCRTNERRRLRSTHALIRGTLCDRTRQRGASLPTLCGTCSKRFRPHSTRRRLGRHRACGGSTAA